MFLPGKGIRYLGNAFEGLLGIRKPPKKLQGPLASSADNSGALDILPQDGRYRYSPLASAQHPDAIRLVRIEPGAGAQDIRCSVIHTTLSQGAGTYEALSYAWGHAGVKEDIIFSSNGAKLAVPSNCVSALRLLRYPDRPVLAWIDAICINQEDIVERNAQMVVMGRIYQLANHVVIFLGDRSEDSDLIMDFLAVFQIDNGPGSRKQESPLELDQGRALLNLFERPYFYRVWILQEVFKCPVGNGLIVCGDRWIDWSTLRYLRIVLDDIHEKSLIKHWDPPVPWPYILSLQSYSTFSARKSLFKILMETRDFGSTDPRDKFFALLPLFDDAAKEGLVADYALSTAQVFTTVATYLLKDGLDFLSAVQGSSPAKNLPSWVPDWSQQYKQNQLHPNPSSSFCAGGPFCDAKPFVSRQGGENSPAILNASGFILDVVSIDIDLPCRPDDVEKSNLEFTIDRWDTITRNMEGRQTVRNKLVAEDELQQSVYDSHPFLYSMTKVYSHPLWENPQEFRYPRRRPNPDPMSQTKFIRTTVAAGGKKDEYDDFAAACGIAFGYRKFWQSKEKFMAWEKSVQGAMLGRKLLMTKNGYFGLAPPETRRSDTVCILLGAPMPYVLRRMGSHFRLVGECFVNGLMHGEALKGLDTAASDAEDTMNDLPKIQIFEIW